MANKRGRPKKIASTPEPSKDFSITLKIGDKIYSSTGTTAAEALIGIKRPVKIMSKGTLTIIQGERKYTKVLWPMKIKQLLMNPTYRKIKANQLERAMK